MKTPTIQKNKLNRSQISTFLVDENISRPKPRNFVDYLGRVNYATNERVLGKIREISANKPNEDIHMTVTSPGGPTGTAMSFFDHIKYTLKPKLITIGSGDVDSSGVLIFLAGTTRYVTRHTTGLLHLAGRTFDSGARFTALDMRAMFEEDRIKDEQYADVISRESRGRLTKEEVIELMSKNTVLTPDDFVRYGLAEKIIG